MQKRAASSDDGDPWSFAMTEHDGLRRMQAEMARQCADALATLDENRGPAAQVADSIRATGSVVLCAMGGSHHVNTIVAPLYRALGFDARAWVGSELLSAPLPPARRTVLIASQSGRSGEIVESLGLPARQDERFALTLDGDSPLAKGCRAALVAHGGPEQAFAATRSITLTLAMHGAILAALGLDIAPLRRVFEADAAPDMAAADAALTGCDAVIFAGYGAMAGVAMSAALSMMELARVPTIGFEGGQFRHGPFEVLRPGLGIVLFRATGKDGALVDGLAAASVEAGCRVVVLDASGKPALSDTTTIAIETNEGLGAAAAMLLAMQPLNIAMARRTVSGDVGTPVRTSKVTV
jgi:fructoselysine-6-P-deglycase FrlB-like protein